MSQAEKIRQFLLKSVVKHPHGLVSVTAQHFSVSRTTVLRHIQTLVNRGKLVKTGTTKQIIYVLATAMQQAFTFTLDHSFDEFQIFREHVEPAIEKYVSASCLTICAYVVTEMLNNAKDHSRAKSVMLSFNINDQRVSFCCKDRGIGVFANLQQALGFPDARSTMLQLSKGKVTSDSANHTGEGLFFTCRAVDEFTLSANNFCFMRDNMIKDWSFFEEKTDQGTQVDLLISRNSTRSLQDLFKAYQDDESMRFVKTEVIIELAKEYGDRLISRSQAKRVVANLDQFSDVTFDFKNIRAVGQGFVDQVFRVFQNQYPAIKLNYINANDDIDFMIRRGI